MSGKNRYIRGSKKETVLILVKTGVTVDVGDLMFLDNADNLRNDGSSTADYTAYPIEHFRTSGASLEQNKTSLKDYFLGVALDDKDGISNGTDKNIPIAITGKFEYDLKPGRTVYNGDLFCAAGTTIASDLINQKIMKTSDESKALGYFRESKVHANVAEVFIRTALGNKI